jgi:hypothetical protein
MSRNWYHNTKATTGCIQDPLVLKFSDNQSYVQSIELHCLGRLSTFLNIFTNGYSRKEM